MRLNCRADTEAPMNSSAASPWDIPADWPVPDEMGRAHGEALVAHIHDEIAASGGFLSFARYMELALYTPGLGYYSASARKFGAGGDFVTAPEISPLFSRCLARSCADVLTQLGGGDVLELGAGSGVMAADVLRELAACAALPERYCILERSAELRERQRTQLAHSVPQWLERVRWLDAPPAQDWRGVLIANEVLDAWPVTLFGWRAGGVVEYGIGWRDGGFEWRERPADAELAAQVRAWAEHYAWLDDYRSELNPSLSAWMQALTAHLQCGAAIFIDYGYARHEYYRAERAQGTLLCHYRHRAHADPLRLPGLQDITAHVDFTAVAEAATAAGFAVGGYTTQAHFLLDNGIERMLAEATPDLSHDYLRLAAQAKTLLLPGEMGERFKALLLVRGLQKQISGFRGRDLRSRL